MLRTVHPPFPWCLSVGKQIKFCSSMVLVIFHWTLSTFNGINLCTLSATLNLSTFRKIYGRTIAGKHTLSINTNWTEFSQYARIKPKTFLHSRGFPLLFLINSSKNSNKSGNKLYLKKLMDLVINGLRTTMFAFAALHWCT